MPLRPRMLPTAAGPAATGTPAAKAAETATTTKAPAPASEAPASATEDLRKKQPENDAAQGCREDDQYHDNDYNDPAERQSAIGRTHALSRSARLRIGKLDSRIRRNDFGNPAGDQQQGVVVVLAAHQRDGFPLKPTDLAIGQNRFQPVSHFDACAVIPYRVKDQHSAVGRFASDAPFLEQIDRVALNVSAIQRIDCDQGDLSVCFFVDLAAEIGDLSCRTLVENVREIVDVTRGLQLGNGLRPRE